MSVQDKERKKERKRERGAPCLRFQCFSRATTLSDALVSRSVTKLPNVIHAPLRYVTLRRSAEGENENERNGEKQKRRRTNEIVSVETDTRTKKKEEIRTSRRLWRLQVVFLKTRISTNSSNQCEYREGHFHSTAVHAVKRKRASERLIDEKRTCDCGHEITTTSSPHVFSVRTTLTSCVPRTHARTEDWTKKEEDRNDHRRSDDFIFVRCIVVFPTYISPWPRTRRVNRSVSWCSGTVVLVLNNLVCVVCTRARVCFVVFRSFELDFIVRNTFLCSIRFNLWLSTSHSKTTYVRKRKKKTRAVKKDYYYIKGKIVKIGE